MSSLLGLPPARVGPDAAALARLRELVTADEPSQEPHGLPPMDLDTLVATLLAVEDEAVARHRRLGLDDERSAATLADVGRKVASYGDWAPLWWLVEILRADVVATGRLQVQRVPGPDGAELHIPEGGPLTPEAVDAALVDVAIVVGPVPLPCTSWLFDPALEALPETSNIRRFVARFDITPTEPSEAGDSDAARFVFRRPVAEVLDPSLVTPRTTLERVVAEHLRGGRHWSVPQGMLRVGPSSAS